MTSHEMGLLQHITFVKYGMTGAMAEWIKAVAFAAFRDQFCITKLGLLQWDLKLT